MTSEEIKTSVLKSGMNPKLILFQVLVQVRFVVVVVAVVAVVVVVVVVVVVG